MGRHLDDSAVGGQEASEREPVGRPDQSTAGSARITANPGAPVRVLLNPRQVIALQGAVGQRGMARLLAPSAPGGEPVATVQRDSLEAPERSEPASGAAAPPATSPPGDSAPVATEAPPVPDTPTVAGPPIAARSSVVESPGAGGGGSSNGSGAPGLAERFAPRRAAVREAATRRQAHIRDKAAGTGQSIMDSAQTQQRALDAVFTTALERVRTAFAGARDGVEAQRRTKLGEVAGAARTQNAALDASLDTHRRDLLAAADSRAAAARKFGADEAGRAGRECGIRAGRARAIGEQKAQRYRSGERGPRVADETRSMAGEAAGKIEAAGQSVAAGVRKDGDDLAAKFLKEGREAADKLADARRAGQQKIKNEYDTAVRGINKSADDAVDGLRRGADRLTSSLEQQRGQLGSSLGQLGQAGADAMRGEGEKAVGRLDEQTDQANAAIDSAQDRLAGKLAGVPPDDTAQVLAQADAELASSLAEFDSVQEGQVNEVDQAMDTGATDAANRIAAGSDQVRQPVESSGADYENHAADTMGTTNTAIDTAARQAVDGMTQAVADTDRAAARAVTEADTGWGQQLDQGRTQAAKKVDDTLAAQDKVVNELGAKIDDRAHEIQHESWLSRAAHFLGGVLVGMLQELWDFVKILAVVVLVVLAVIVVIAAIILLVGGLDALLAAILAVAAFIAAASSVIEAIVTVLAVIGIVVLLAIAAWRIYQAWTRDDLSDYERGKLVGRSIFDILSIVLPGRVLKFLGESRWLTALIESLGGDARFVILLIWARGDIAGVRAIIADVGAMDEVMVIVQRTAGITEFLELRGLVGETPRLIRLLRLAPNVAELRTVLLALGRDSVLLEDLLNGSTWAEVAQLVRTVTTAGGDATLLRTMLGRAGSVAELNRLLGIVTGSGGDAPMLGRLLAGTSSTAELDGLLTRLHNNAPLLDDLIKITDDIPQLNRMLAALNDDGVTLRNLITAAGGKAGASTVADLLDLAVARGHPPADIADLLGKAAGNTTELQRLAGYAKLLAARTPAPATAGPAIGSYAGSNMQHFLDGHTFDYFDFARVDANGKTFWAPGTTAADVEAELRGAVNMLDNPGQTVTSLSQGPSGQNVPTPVRVLWNQQPNTAVPAGAIKGPLNLDLPSGAKVRFGTTLPNSAPAIGQFFPLQTSPGAVHLPQDILLAIAKIVQ